MKLKVLATTGLVLSLGLTSLGYGGTTLAQTRMGSTEDIGKDAKVFNVFSTLDDSQNKMKKSLKVSFIDDPNANKKIALISTDGSNIDADKQIPPGNGYMGSILQWSSEYHMGMELSGGSSSFHKVSPINTIDTKTVSSTVGYTVGGTIKIGSSADSSISSGANWSTTTSYNQPDYKTILTKDTSKQVQWEVPFVSAMNQGYGPYTRDSNDSIYGNQLFMKSRNANVWAKDNFLSSNEMPTLAAYNFSPGVLAVITADKSEKTSNLTVTFKRVSDNYYMDWIAFLGGYHASGAGWWKGKNEKGKEKTSSSKYVLDWENHNLIEN